jgi:hypothetical protein
MLRSFVIAMGALALGCGILAGFVGGFPATLGLVVFGLLTLLGTLYERVYYKPLDRQPPAGNWVRTAERFVDEKSGAPVTVWLDPATGERRYVRD